MFLCFFKGTLNCTKIVWYMSFIFLMLHYHQGNEWCVSGAEMTHQSVINVPNRGG